ncbi:MAG TPA: hypothetical protein VHH36_05660 [Candidatus Thermoplasmatota archaeon]|nr:hypothetical protein [Candidatus Thermoplasmatota archaeon]
MPAAQSAPVSPTRWRSWLALETRADTLASLVALGLGLGAMAALALF